MLEDEVIKNEEISSKETEELKEQKETPDSDVSEEENPLEESPASPVERPVSPETEEVLTKEDDTKGLYQSDNDEKYSPEDIPKIKDFKKANLDSETDTIGSILYKARCDKGDDISKIVEITKVRRKYLEALEKDDFEVIPNLLVAKGFMKIYADYLRLNVDQMIEKFNNKYQKEMDNSNEPPKNKEIKFGSSLDKKDLVSKALKDTNQGAFAYTGKVKSSKMQKLIFSVVGAIAVVYLAIFLSNLYFKNTVGTIKVNPRTQAEVKVLEAKLTPEALQNLKKEYDKVVVTAKATNKTYVTVVMDGRIVFKGNMVRGNTKSWEGSQYIKIKAIDPTVVELFVNTEYLGVMDDKAIPKEVTYYPPRPEDEENKTDTSD